MQEDLSPQNDTLLQIQLAVHLSSLHGIKQKNPHAIASNKPRDTANRISN